MLVRLPTRQWSKFGIGAAKENFVSWFTFYIFNSIYDWMYLTIVLKQLQNQWLYINNSSELGGENNVITQSFAKVLL